MAVLNIAHRGARSLAPENTLAAARKAWQIGADLWETDVLVTADGELILMHDDSLERTTDAALKYPDRAPWMVTEFSWAEIAELETGARFIDGDPFGQIAAGAVSPGEQVAFLCEKVPTLQQALEFTMQANWRVNLELKLIPAPLGDFPVVERVLDLVEYLNMDPAQVVISSFYHPWLQQVQSLRPGIEVQALVGALDVPAESAFATYNGSAEQVDDQQIAAAQERGVGVNLYTVNELDAMRRFIAAGVSGLFTDFPQRLKTLQNS